LLCLLNNLLDELINWT